MISVVCVYNNKEILEEFLLKSLKRQSVEYELFLMDNRKGKFKSAAEALNKGAKETKSKYIMFVHQDVDLSSNTYLEDTEKMLDSIPNLGIAGVAGKIKYGEGMVTTIEDGIPPQKIPSFIFKTPVKVQTLDECLFIIPKSVFNILQFDEETCDDWHLYAVDYSLTVKDRGFDVYVISNPLYHRSPGFSYSKMYDSTLKKVLKKHCKEGVIYTSMGNWITFCPVSVQIKFQFLKEITIKLFEKIKKIKF